MTILICFICGIVFVAFALPIIQYFADMICSLFELLKSSIAVKITQNNDKITRIQEQLQNDIEPVHTNAIGFVTEEKPEYIDDEDKMNNKRRIGFRG